MPGRWGREVLRPLREAAWGVLEQRSGHVVQRPHSQRYRQPRSLPRGPRWPGRGHPGVGDKPVREAAAAHAPGDSYAAVREGNSAAHGPGGRRAPAMTRADRQRGSHWSAGGKTATAPTARAHRPRGQDGGCPGWGRGRGTGSPPGREPGASRGGPCSAGTTVNRAVPRMRANAESLLRTRTQRSCSSCSGCASVKSRPALPCSSAQVPVLVREPREWPGAAPLATGRGCRAQDRLALKAKGVLIGVTMRPRHAGGVSFPFLGVVFYPHGCCEASEPH